MSSTPELLASVAPEISRSGPFKFLDYYEESDKSSFAGRDHDIRELIARITTERLVILYGRSGLGKTSLLLAGLFPELRPRGFHPIFIRVLESPLSDTCTALAEELKLEKTARPDEVFRELKADKQQKRYVLVLDQFEEFFIRFEKQPEERRRFINWLSLVIADTSIDFRFLISLREEYLSRMDEFVDDLSGHTGSQYRLQELTAFGARQAITRPLNAAGIDYDQLLINRLIDLLAEEQFDSLLLQIVCTGIYRVANERGGKPLRLLEQDLDAVGGWESILRSYLDLVTQQVNPSHLLLTRTILDTLITTENTKRAVTLDTLLNADFEATREEIEAVLDSLEKPRLVRKEPRGQKIWYELAHERLVKPILEWFQRDPTFTEYRFARDLIFNGSRNEMFRTRIETLLNKDEINNVIGPVRRRLRLPPLQAEFMFWSAVYRQTDDVNHWASLFDLEQSAAVLQQLLAHKDPLMRAGAAFAIANIPALSGRFVAACLEMAMNDQNQDTRKAAARAFAAGATPADVSRLKELVRPRSSRKNALAVLAILHGTKKPMQGIPWRWRRRARRVFEGWSYSENGDIIRKLGRSGAIGGLLAGIAWQLTVGLGFLMIASWLGGQSQVFAWNSRFFFLFGWEWVFVLGFATVSAWQTCIRGTRRRLLAPTESWFALAARVRAHQYLLTAIAALFVILMLRDEREVSLEPKHMIVILLASLGTPYVIRLAIAPAAKLAQECIQPGKKNAAAFFWMWLICLAAPFLVTLLITTGILELRHKSSWQFLDSGWCIFFSVLVSTAWSLLTFSTGIGLMIVDNGLKPAVAKAVTTRRTVVARSTAVLLALGLVVFYLMSFGYHSIPWLAGDPVVLGEKPGEPITVGGQFGGLWPTSRYYRLSSNHDTLYSVDIQKLNAASSNLGERLPFFYDYGSDLDRFILLGPGNHLASLSTGPNDWQNHFISFAPVQKFNPGAKVELTRNWVYGQLKLNTDGGGSASWEADLEGYINPTNADEGVEIWWPYTEERGNDSQFKVQVSAVGDNGLESMGWAIPPGAGRITHEYVPRDKRPHGIRYSMSSSTMPLVVSAKKGRISVHIKLLEKSSRECTLLFGMRTLPREVLTPKHDEK